MHTTASVALDRNICNVQMELQQACALESEWNNATCAILDQFLFDAFRAL